MTNIDVIKEGFAACQAGDFKKLSNMITDDFKLEGPVPEPIGKKEFIGLMTAMITAFPDWKFNVSDIEEKGDKVFVTTRISGTQTATLTLPMLPQPVKPTGKHFQLPAEHQAITVKNGKMSHYKVDVVPGGGVMGVLSQLGVAMPTH